MGAYEKPRENTERPVRRTRRKRKSRLPLLLGILVICAAVALTIWLCFFRTPSSEPELPTAPTEVFSGLSIATPVGELFYPEQWADSIRIETANDPYSATVYGSAEGREAALFTIYVGGTGAGHLFGTAKTSNGARMELRVDVYDFSPDTAWSQEASDAIYAMQERVNDIIEQIYLLPDFQAA